MKYFNLHQLSGPLFLTYLNALCGVAGIVAVSLGRIEVALGLLVVAALIDAFDGVVARIKKQTSAQQKLGTIADSVADMVSFGVLPAVIFISLSSLNWVTAIVAGLYVLAAIHRLLVFTVNALEVQRPMRHFTGLPVVMGAVTMPIVYVLFNTFSWFEPVLVVLVLVLAVLYVSKLSIAKPRGSMAYASYLLIAGTVIAGIVVW